jgi:hypothetical protein
VQADFSDGHLSSDDGALLLRQIDANLGICSSLARCFIDRRAADWIDHSVREWIAQTRPPVFDWIWRFVG